MPCSMSRTAATCEWKTRQARTTAMIMTDRPPERLAMCCKVHCRVQTATPFNCFQWARWASQACFWLAFVDSFPLLVVASRDRALMATIRALLAGWPPLTSQSKRSNCTARVYPSFRLMTDSESSQSLFAPIIKSSIQSDSRGCSVYSALSVLCRQGVSVELHNSGLITSR